MPPLGRAALSQPACLPCHLYQNALPFSPPWQLLWAFQPYPDALRALMQLCGGEAFPFPKQRSKEARPLTPGRTLCFHFPSFNLL